jgi:methylphosphotriester-DNA--protein-cysteine methyltransferase
MLLACILFELRRVKGLTYSRWISQLRLAKAKDLLANTALSFTAIAVSMGFPNIGFFSMVQAPCRDEPHGLEEGILWYGNGLLIRKGRFSL